MTLSSRRGFSWLSLSLLFFAMIALVRPAWGLDCKQEVKSVDLAFPLEGSPSEYGIFLDYGVPWCNDENGGFSWGVGPQGSEGKYNGCQTSLKHLGIDIKFAREASSPVDANNSGNGISPDVTNGKKVYAAYDGKACLYNAGGNWAEGVYIRHEVKGFVFYTIYTHLKVAGGILSGNDLCTNGVAVKRRQPIGTPHVDSPDDSLKIAGVADLPNLIVHDRDHLHFALRCDDMGQEKKCGGGSESELASQGGNCMDPKPFFTELKPIFPDVPTSVWFAKPVYFLRDKGIVHGYANGGFKPGNYTTRAEFITMVARVSGDDSCNGKCLLPSSYNDMQNHWACQCVQSVYDKGWLDKNKASFLPDTLINRAEVANILVTVRGLTKFCGNGPLIESFEDVKNGEWYYMPVYISKTCGIFSGYPEGQDDCKGGKDPGKAYFCPGRNINRAETATVIYQAIPGLFN